MPALEGIDGCVGLSLLVDRTSGRCIATSAWQSEEAMRASEESVRPIRDQAAELFGGSAQIEEWEIAAMHREHSAGEGACVRAIWVKVDPDQIDGGIDFYKTTILPALEGLEGFCSASLLVDRASGRGVAAATFRAWERRYGFPTPKRTVVAHRSKATTPRPMENPRNCWSGVTCQDRPTIGPAPDQWPR